MSKHKNIETKTIVYDPEENILMVFINQPYHIPDNWALMSGGKTYQYNYTIDEITETCLVREIYLKEVIDYKKA